MSGREQAQRPFKCEYPNCDWSFTRQEHLTRHLRTHSGEKPFKCSHPDCNSRFSRKDELQRHQRLTHTPTNSYHQAALVDTGDVVYTGHGRTGRQSEQSRNRDISDFPSGHVSTTSNNPPVLPSSNYGGFILPLRPAASMSTYNPPTQRRPGQQPEPNSRRHTEAPPSYHLASSLNYGNSPAFQTHRSHPPQPPSQGQTPGYHLATIPPHQSHGDGHVPDDGRSGTRRPRHFGNDGFDWNLDRCD